MITSPKHREATTTDGFKAAVRLLELALWRRKRQQIPRFASE